MSKHLLGFKNERQAFSWRKTILYRLVDTRYLSHHPPVGETWRKDQQVIRPKAVVSNQLLLSREEPITGFVLSISWYFMYHLLRSILTKLPERGAHQGRFSPNPRTPGFFGGLGECAITKIPRRNGDQIGRYCDRLVVLVSHKILAYDFPVVGWTIGRGTDTDRRQQCG